MALPVIQAHGGTPVQLPGDAVMAIFGAPRQTPGDAGGAARAALEIQDRSCAADDRPDVAALPHRVNDGEALVGNIGSEEFRNFTAIGDTSTWRSDSRRWPSPGQVVTEPNTAARLGEAAAIEWLDDV